MNKHIYLPIILLIVAHLTNAAALTDRKSDQLKKDSIIVSFGGQTKLVIYGKDRKELDQILKYDLNALLKDLKVKLDSSTTDTTYIREEINGNTYLKNGVQQNDEDYVRIGMRGIHVKDGDTEVTIDAKGVEVHDGSVVVSSDSTYRRTGKRFHRYHWNSSPRKGFNVALGLNAYGSNETTPGYNKSDYDLKPFGSRYISLGYVVSTTLVKGKGSRLYLDFGADVSWYNLMFDNDFTLEKNDERVNFVPVRDAANTELPLKTSKLVVPYVNLSLMPTLSFSRSFVSHLSAGVYGGYRIGSYTKVRAEGTKDVNRVRQNFYLEDLRYGLAAELGIRNFPDLFVQYDMNNLYQQGKGPGVRMLSFGLRLF